MFLDNQKLNDYMSLFQLTDFENCEPIRIGSPFDGGYVALNHNLDKVSALYSYGVSDNIDFEIEFCYKFNASAFLYDHTIDQLPFSVKGLHWYKQGIAHCQSECFDTLSNHLDATRDICDETGELVLKMDVEGAEYKSLSSTPDEVLSRFSQIYIELHGVDNIDTLEKYTEKYQFMKKLTHQFYIYHAHINNYANIIKIGKYRIPQVLELTLVNRKTTAATKKHTRNLPIKRIDSSNCYKRCDPKLNFYPFTSECSFNEETSSNLKKTIVVNPKINRFSPVYRLRKVVRGIRLRMYGWKLKKMLTDLNTT